MLKDFNPCKKFDVKDIDTSHFNPKEYLEHDFKGFIEITSLRDQIPNKHELCWETGCEVAKGVEIPKSLLSGPWSDEDIKHLFWTIKSGAELSWLNSIAGEMAVDGMKYAISIGNIHIIYLLLWRGLWKSGIECMFHQIIDGHKMLVWALRNVGGDALAVMTHLLSLARDIISSEEKDEILAELSYIQSEAIRTNDLAKTSWVLLLQPVAKEIMKPLT
ncbi:hypothetical protein HI914_02759 [Erysiphe necator]|nr:hypothetical protein HI914_02759 [Erysiphe necator]